MEYQIKHISKTDIPEMVGLYKVIYADRPELMKDQNELEWLFSDPDNHGQFNGFIARKPNNEVSGIIGYTINSYQYMDRISGG